MALFTSPRLCGSLAGEHAAAGVEEARAADYLVVLEAQRHSTEQVLWNVHYVLKHCVLGIVLWLKEGDGGSRVYDIIGSSGGEVHSRTSMRHRMWVWLWN